jgi:hypothetical protein
MTSEQGPLPTPADQLRELLLLDFSPAPLPPSAPGERRDAFAEFMHNVRAVEEVEERRESEESQELVWRTETALEVAPVTELFKEFIVAAVRHAHAWRSPVGGVVAPDRLGLTSGPGIFDPERASELEAQAFRGYLTSVFERNVALLQTSDQLDTWEGEFQVVTPERFAQDMDRVARWAEDFQGLHDRNPMGDVDIKAFYLVARPLHVLDPDDPNDALWIAALERLPRRRRADNDDS